jgi:3-oxoacyl-[acyl-carrier protein] reductase
MLMKAAWVARVAASTASRSGSFKIRVSYPIAIEVPMLARMTGRIALITGVSRQAGIGFGIARRMLAEGASVAVQSWSRHDAEQPWGADPFGTRGVVEALGGESERLGSVEADLADPEAPRRVVEFAVDRFGAIDILVANHARSAAGSLQSLTARDLDLAWEINARAVVLLVQAYAERHDDLRRDGRVVLFTSGQHLGPMASELPYAISKGAVHQMTWSLADALADRGITVNAINPGPVDTGWATDEVRERLRDAFPAGRWGAPADIAAIVSWLAGPESAWITGQVINAEGGFRR